MNPAQVAQSFVFEPTNRTARPKPSAKANDPHKGRYLIGGPVSADAAGYIVEATREFKMVEVTALSSETSEAVQQFYMQPRSSWEKADYDDLINFMRGAIAMAMKIEGGAQ